MFLAAELPEAVLRQVGRLQTQLREQLGGWRWTRAEGIHLTLRFLGEVGDADDLRARPTWRATARSCTAPRVGLGRLGCFPQRGSPRVLWLGVEERPSSGVSFRNRGDTEAAVGRMRHCI